MSPENTKPKAAVVFATHSTKPTVLSPKINKIDSSSSVFRHNFNKIDLGGESLQEAPTKQTENDISPARNFPIGEKKWTYRGPTKEYRNVTCPSYTRISQHIR